MFKWYVFRWDSNSDTLKKYNIISDSLLEDIKLKRRRKKINNIQELKEYLKREFMYHYWSKCEYEMLVNGLFNKEESEVKIDIWYQIEPNLDLITDLIAQELKFKFKKES